MAVRRKLDSVFLHDVSICSGVRKYCYERDFMNSLNHDNQADVIEAFNSTPRYMYLDDPLNIDNPYFEGMVKQIYTGVQLVFFFCSGVSKLLCAQGSPSSGRILNL